MISKTQGPKLKVIDTPGVAEVHADNVVSVIATQAGAQRNHDAVPGVMKRP